MSKASRLLKKQMQLQAHRACATVADVLGRDPKAKPALIMSSHSANRLPRK